MQGTPREVIIAYIASLAFWVLAVIIIWLAGRKWPTMQAFKDRMMGQWKPALGIGLVFAASTALESPGFNGYGVVLGTMMTFCQTLIGLALARGIIGFEPLPVARAVATRQRVLRRLLLMIGVALAAVVAAQVAGGVGTVMARILGEAQQSTHSSDASMPTLWRLFFYFLSGAGIAEETVYHLVIVSLLWKLSSRAWVAMVISGLLFGVYHLTPLSGMYLTFWQYPLTQFLSSVLIGIVWAYVYVKRGYETAVLAHTLSDWLPAAIFMLLMR